MMPGQLPANIDQSVKELRDALPQAVLSECSKRFQFATKASWIGILGVAVICLFSCFAAPDLFAHTLDTSYCKVRITQHEIEFKFTYDLLTLQRIFPLDANHDDRISRTEVEAAVAKIRDFLRDHIYVELNQRDTEFADA